MQQHRKIRGAVGDLAAMVWGQVLCEPIVFDTGIDPSGEIITVDLSVRGF